LFATKAECARLTEEVATIDACIDPSIGTDTAADLSLNLVELLFAVIQVLLDPFLFNAKTLHFCGDLSVLIEECA